MAEPAETVDPAEADLGPEAPLTALRGVGDKLAGRLTDALAVRTVQDLVFCFPRRLREVREVPRPDEEDLGTWVRLAGRVDQTRLSWLPGRRSLVTVHVVVDGDARVEVSFFNQPYLKNTYPVGSQQVVEGVLERKGPRFQLKQPRFLAADAPRTGSCQLLYPDVPGVSAARLAALIGQALERVDLESWPAAAMPVILGVEPPPFAQAVRDMHQPRTVACHQRARQRFAVGEALQLFRRVERRRRDRLERRAPAIVVDTRLEKRILGVLPFTPTRDQSAAIQKIWRLLQGPAPMGLLLQGDVATGKTAVALCAALAAVAAGHQVAFLAPTELLAEQHFAGIRAWLAAHPIEVALLTASVGDREAIAAGVQEGRIDLVFGTHALFSKGTGFARLGLVIIDEQHRFGVDQRERLVRKGDNPHVLYMTATPIPRTLTLTLFGDLDLALLRERPPGHRAAPALHLPKERFSRILRCIERRVARRQQVYVVCPKVGEDGGKGGAVRLHTELSKGFACGLVHGQMETHERQATLAAFREGAFDVLVGTTVLEVGVDVPRATLMVVIGCDRFGLATLHQLRGRVGRGARRGLCILTGERTPRTRVICATTDGFELAEQDLLLRGSGEILGTRQSGLSELRALDPVADLDLLSAVRDHVRDAEGATAPPIL